VPDALGGAGAVWVLGAGQCWGAGSALRRTQDYWATWGVVCNFSLQYLSPLAVHAATGRIALVATVQGEATPHVHVSLDGARTWQPVDLAERGHYLAPGVSGLEFDAVDPTVLYISTNGHSVVVAKFDE
jgi:hypothetical protein